MPSKTRGVKLDKAILEDGWVRKKMWGCDDKGCSSGSGSIGVNTTEIEHQPKNH